jgi:FkbM family methyltransferase
MPTSTTTRTKHIVISGTNFWNPGDDFVRDGVIRVLRELFKGQTLNFLFYNFNADFFPQEKFSGISNWAAPGDLDQYRDFVDAVVVAGLSAGNEIKDLYRWIIQNRLQDRVYLVGAGYENEYVAAHIAAEPEATIFKHARVVVGRTEKTPPFISALGIPYAHINCPAMLSVPDVKLVPAGRKIERIGFSIQLSHGVGLVNHSCANLQYQLAVEILCDLAKDYSVEIIAHHKTEYFHFLKLLHGKSVPVLFSSFYQDLFDFYPRYDCVITTRLHSSLFANGHGIPGIIINDTDRHTHAVKGFPHSVCVNTRARFDRAFEDVQSRSLCEVATEAREFKAQLLETYLETLVRPFGLTRAHPALPRHDRINVGCGLDYREGFVNVDWNALLPKVDQVLVIRPGSLPREFPAGHFRHVLAKDFLEEHSHRVGRELLKDFFKLLQPGGVLELYLPNLEVIVNDPRMGIREKQTFLYGGQDIRQQSELAYKYGWIPEELREELFAVGFEDIKIAVPDGSWNMHVRAQKPDSCGSHIPDASSVQCSPMYEFDSERKEQALVRRLVQPGMTVLDVGANIGKYTKLFSLLVGDSGRVFAFEPDPDSARRIDEMVSRDTLSNVTLVNRAVSEQSGKITLNRFPEAYSSWNSIGHPQMEDPRNPTQLVPIVSSVEVEAVTLDHFCRTHGVNYIDYLKLDVEGAEFIALKGASDLLSRRAIRHLQFEISRKMLDGLNTSAKPVFDLLAAHGYESHAITSHGQVGDRVADSSAFYDNYIAIPSHKPSLSSGQAVLLTIHFFTIVLNGEPFIRYHIEVFRQLPFPWHWHIIEGVAEHNHDTDWSVRNGGRITDQLHRNGLSTDGTSQYIDSLAKEFPQNVTIHRKPGGQFWDGKLEMVNAPLVCLNEACLLWQVDADELWTIGQITRARELFVAQPQKTAALYYCHYFVGENLVITTRNTYGNNIGYEWIRTWRFSPGCRWTAHEPPRLCRPTGNGQLEDLATVHPLRHAETEAAGLTFQHFAYATAEQLQFKETYYGYKGALRQWDKLQQQRDFPVLLSQYFDWVEDAAQVNTTESQRIDPLAKRDSSGAWKFAMNGPRVHGQRVLFVRTDSIGDAVLASSMLPHLHRRFPQAQFGILCQDRVADLFTACPHVTTIIAFDKSQASNEAHLRGIVAEIAQFNPQLILNSVRSRDALSETLTLVFRESQHIGVEADLANMSEANRNEAQELYSRIIPSPGAHRSELDRHQDFLSGLDIHVTGLQPKVWTSPEDEALAEAFFATNQLDPEQTIAVFPGAQHECRVYGSYAAALREINGFDFLVFGAEADEPLAKNLTNNLPGRVFNLCGRTSLRETAALLRRCRLYVGAESAGAHIACAVGVPNVVVLGGGHFGRFMPYSPLTSAVSLPLDCFGCDWRCKHKRPHCIKDITPELLVEAIRQTLECQSQRPRVFIQPEASWLGGGALPVWTPPAVWLRGDNVEIISPEGIATPSLVGPEIMSGTPVVTAIVSTYNSERFMASCMDDMVAQTILNKLEILVIDSGSQENERSVVERYQKRFPNIRYVRTEREPLYTAWNRAVKLARGKYVVNANTDDSRRPDAFEILLHGMEAHPDADLAYAHYGMTSKPNDPFPPSGVFRDVCHDPYHPAQLLFYCITGCLQFWRKTSLEKIGGFDDSLKCVGDYEILLRFMRLGMKPLMIPDKLSNFYLNRDGLSLASTTAIKEDMAVKKRYRQEVKVSEIYAVDPNNPQEMAMAWICLGNFAAKVPVPWEDLPHRFFDFSIYCYGQALRCDSALEAAWHNMAVVALLTNNTDHLIKTFSVENQHIHTIITNAEKDPRLVNYNLKPKVVGHIYRYR